MKQLYTRILLAYGLTAIFLFGIKDYIPLDTIAYIATILSLILVPSLYFLDARRVKQDERTRASKNLYGELGNTQCELEWRENKEVSADEVIILKVGTSDGVEKYVVTNKFLNHDVYDSLISSGRINFLRYELQQQVQNIFKMIKQHNQYLQSIRDITNQDLIEREKTKLLPPYYKIAVSHEQDLLDQIPDIMKKLVKEFPRITQSESDML